MCVRYTQHNRLAARSFNQDFVYFESWQSREIVGHKVSARSFPSSGLRELLLRSLLYIGLWLCLSLSVLDSDLTYSTQPKETDRSTYEAKRTGAHFVRLDSFTARTSEQLFDFWVALVGNY